MRKNRRKKNIDTSSLLVVIGAAFLVAIAGLMYISLKNQQIIIERRIAKKEDQIAQHDLDVKTHRMEIDKVLNRYLIKDQLALMRSSLKSITPSVVLHVKSASEVSPPQLAVADP